jgi:hypothetical protein
MTTQKKYAELVAQAENAVSSVKDPELRRAAFEKVLDDLLAAAGPSVSAKTQEHVARPRSGAQRKRKRSAGPSGYIEELIDEKFFKKPKTISQVKAELANRGHHIPLTSLSGPLQKLCQCRLLRRHKAKTTRNKQTYNYSEW